MTMTKVQHTPGPWVTDGTDVCQTIRSDGSSCLHVIAQMSYPLSGGIGEYKEIELANARLIAAAPDLLSALQNLVNGIDTGAITSDYDEVFANARKQASSAIAKAKGE